MVWHTLGLRDVDHAAARHVVRMQLVHDPVTTVPVRRPGERQAHVVAAEVTGEAVHVGVVSLQAEEVPAAEVGHEARVLARAQARVAGDDLEGVTERLAHAGSNSRKAGASPSFDPITFCPTHCQTDEEVRAARIAPKFWTGSPWNPSMNCFAPSTVSPSVRDQVPLPSKLTTPTRKASFLTTLRAMRSFAWAKTASSRPAGSCPASNR